MDKTVLGRTGLPITRIGFGGIPIQRLSVVDAVTVLHKALDMGCGLIDTARVYSDSETKIGAALDGRPEKPVLVSKSYSRDADGARKDVDLSCRNLRVPAVHVYMIHNINTVELLDGVMAPGGALDGLRRAQAEGLIRAVGASSHKPQVLAEAVARDAFDVMEVPFSAVETESLTVLRDARAKGMGTIAMKPLAGGALRDARAAIRFVLEHPVTCVVPGMQTVAEVEQDLTADAPLSEPERAALLEDAAQWKGRFCRRCEYCLPACPKKINITLVLLFGSYAERYGLHGWSRERYGTLAVKAGECEDCGKCEERCPYDLPIREMLRKAHKVLTE